MRGYAILATITSACTYVLMLLGAYVKAIGAGLACPDWPSCFADRGGLEAWLPHEIYTFSDKLVAAEWWHRFMAAFIVGPLILAMVWSAWKYYRDDKRITYTATAALVLLPIQAYVGGYTVTSSLQPSSVVAHQGLAILVLTCLVASALFAWVRPPKPRATKGAAATLLSLAAVEVAHGRSGSDTGFGPALRGYMSLLKPRILMLLVLTGYAGIVIAPGWRELSWFTITITLIGGALNAGSANVFNNVFDRDIDEKMVRTSRRAIPSGAVSVTQAAVFGTVLGLLSTVMLWAWVNPLSAILSVGGLLFYVLIYTLVLKRRTPQNITIGGAAGGFPALVGWAAVTNEVGAAAILLGALVVLWTPPHFWALALVYAKDYARADVPMLPVVKGEKNTRFQMLVYTVLLIAASAAFVWPLGVLGIPYLVMALALGAPFLWYAWVVFRGAGKKQTYRMFTYSIAYLGLIYLAMVVDRLVFA